MTDAARGWARVAMAALVLVGFGWSCAQSRAAESKLDGLRDTVQETRRSYAFALEVADSLRKIQVRTDSAATERVAAANERADRAEAAASDARESARNITRQLESTLPAADSARVVLATEFYEAAIDSLEVVIDQRDSVIVSRELQIFARDERLYEYENALLRADSTIAAYEALTDAQDRARGWKVPLLGIRIDVRCGPSVTAGVTVTGRLDVVGGVGCTVG